MPIWPRPWPAAPTCCSMAAWATLVQAAGLHTVHAVPDLLNLTHPEAIVAIQRQYVEAGADCITTNTFSANRLKLASTDATVAEVYAGGCGQRAGGRSAARGRRHRTDRRLARAFGHPHLRRGLRHLRRAGPCRRDGRLRPHRRGNYGRPAGGQGRRSGRSGNYLASRGSPP